MDNCVTFLSSGMIYAVRTLNHFAQQKFDRLLRTVSVAKKETGMIRRVILATALLAGLTSASASTSFARPHRSIDDNDTVVLSGNIHPHARPESDVGATDPALVMERMVLSLRMPADKQEELNRLLADQQDPASPDYHRWLTPEQFGERFGAEQDDIDELTAWLTSHGFTVEKMPKGRSWINFSGTVAGVERTFRTRMREYHINGRRRHANDRDPEIPRGITDLVNGIVSLHNFPRKTMNSGIRQLAQEELIPEYTSGSRHYISPADFATIYNVNALYNEGVDGSGQSIAIVGRTHPSSTNWSSFRSQMGLPANPPLVIVNGTDPGDQGADENGEADLDVEWSGAVARNATVKFVVSASTNTTDGVDLSAQYIVDNNLAAVMSTSFGQCESLMGSAENAFYRNLWQRAAAQGITSFVSSGDSGVAGCSGASATSATVKGVNGLASTPYNVAVGGTQFNEGGGTYWNSVNGAGYSSAIGYIPETAWNESATVTGGSGLWSTGGGVSSIYSKPAWQVSPGVPADGKRDVPDVSLTSAIHDGYLVRTQGSLSVIGGTSAAAPAFAGLMALIVQKTGQRQGNANPRLYQIGNAQYGSGGAKVFHDIVSGNNSVPGLTGYAAATGYDLATGLGSVDAYALASQFMPSIGSQTVPAVFWNNPDDIGSRTPLSAIQLNATASIPGTFSYSPPAGSYPGVGSGRILSVTFTPADTTNFAPLTKTVTINVLDCNGDFNGNGVIDIGDALLALKTSVGLHATTPGETARGDVSPLANGLPAPDGTIDLNDALIILKKTVGLAKF